jgi:hypothetical protein
MSNKHSENEEIPDLVSESGEEGEIMEDDDDMMMEEEAGLEAFLATEDGDTICTAMVDVNETLGEIARQLTTTNRILVKMLSKLS